jgi:hypothetical protein
VVVGSIRSTNQDLHNAHEVATNRNGAVAHGFTT